MTPGLNKNILLFCCLAVPILGDEPRLVVLQGKVVAVEVSNFQMLHPPQYTTFVLKTRSRKSAAEVSAFVKIRYRADHRDEELPADFLTGKKEAELELQRLPECDERFSRYQRTSKVDLPRKDCSKNEKNDENCKAFFNGETSPVKRWRLTKKTLPVDGTKLSCFAMSRSGLLRVGSFVGLKPSSE